jgi:hypothetical protein
MEKRVAFLRSDDIERVLVEPLRIRRCDGDCRDCAIAVPADCVDNLVRILCGADRNICIEISDAIDDEGFAAHDVIGELSRTTTKVLGATAAHLFPVMFESRSECVAISWRSEPPPARPRCLRLPTKNKAAIRWHRPAACR